MTTKELPNGLVRLTPDEGKMLYNTNTDKYYSEAEVEKDRVKYFEERVIASEE